MGNKAPVKRDHAKKALQAFNVMRARVFCDRLQLFVIRTKFPVVDNEAEQVYFARRTPSTADIDAAVELVGRHRPEAFRPPARDIIIHMPDDEMSDDNV